jgi:xylulokinase
VDILTNVWGVPVARRMLADEATSIGAAIVGGVGVGIFPDFTVAADLSERATPMGVNEIRHETYRARYVEFLDAYARLEPWFDALR